MDILLHVCFFDQPAASDNATAALTADSCQPSPFLQQLLLLLLPRNASQIHRRRQPYFFCSCIRGCMDDQGPQGQEATQQQHSCAGRVQRQVSVRAEP